MILVVGAAGKTGQAVLRELAGRGVAVRAWVRRSEQVAATLALGAVEAVVGDVRETAVWQQATADIHAIYHICPNMHPAEVEIGRLAIAAAQANGVAHFVYHSVLHPQVEAMPHHWYKMRVEAQLFASELPFTILQPAAYMQNVLAGKQSIIADGVYRVPYPVETVLSMVDLRDVAAAAAIVLTEPGHQGAIYECVGPDLLSQTAVSHILTRQLRRPIHADQIPIDKWRTQAELNGLGTYQIETLIKMFRYYAAYNFIGNAHVLRSLLDREPIAFTEFVQHYLGWFRNPRS